MSQSAEVEPRTCKYVIQGGGTYEGESVVGKTKGRGKFVYASGCKYDGDWVADKLFGQGKFEQPDEEARKWVQSGGEG